MIDPESPIFGALLVDCRDILLAVCFMPLRRLEEDSPSDLFFKLLYLGQI